MKLDKETLIVIFISMVILIGWEPFAVKMGWLPDPKAVQTQTVTPAEEAKEPSVAKAEAKAPETVAEIVDTAAKKIEPKIQLPVGVVLENDNVIVKFNSDYSAIESITFKKFMNNAKTAPITVKNDYNSNYGMLQLFSNDEVSEIISTALVFDKADAKSLSQKKFAVAKKVVLKNGQTLSVTQEFALADDYSIKSKLYFWNNSSKELVKLNPIVWAGDLQSWSQLSGDEIRMAKFVYAYYNAKGDYETIDSDAKDKEFAAASAEKVDWAAITNKFFALVFKAEQAFFNPTVDRKHIGEDEYLLAFQADLGEVVLSPQQHKEYDFTFYVGPKESEFLQAVSPECTKLVKFSWGPLNGLAKALLWVLIKLHGICGSYGWSIIILTIIVRLLFWPVTQKANDSMKKMQNLKPQIDKLREQYKTNPQMLNMKTMELYKKEGVNPVGGCLPILLQIPVFFALYATLDGAFALRQVSFAWVENLAAPDTILSFPLGFTIFGISNFDLNPLVIAMTVLMVLQQKLTPTAMDPMQQKMMALMPIFMLIFLYELPAGLTLYWTVSQLFSILQLVLQRRKKKLEKA
ncbi:MAG: membrane protein insertase YidC [Lentisphaeria bacterium]|nr:membrane protein insertase YidC [Lentisphaeria bacterium]